MTTATVTGMQLQHMVRHWLSTPACAYLGSAYGHNLAGWLQQPLQAHNGADEVIAKLRQDIRLLAILPPESLNLYATEQDNQPPHLSLEMAGQSVPVTMGTR